VTTTHALFAVKVQREGEQWCCWIGRSQIIFGSAERSRSCHRRDAEQRTRNCSNRGTGSELRISDAGAQTPIVSGGPVGRAKVSLSRSRVFVSQVRRKFDLRHTLFLQLLYPVIVIIRDCRGERHRSGHSDLS
jgi:hypothetical protein